MPHSLPDDPETLRAIIRETEAYAFSVSGALKVFAALAERLDYSMDKLAILPGEEPTPEQWERYRNSETAIRAAFERLLLSHIAMPTALPYMRLAGSHVPFVETEDLDALDSDIYADIINALRRMMDGSSILMRRAFWLHRRAAQNLAGVLAKGDTPRQARARYCYERFTQQEATHPVTYFMIASEVNKRFPDLDRWTGTADAVKHRVYRAVQKHRVRIARGEA